MLVSDIVYLKPNHVSVVSDYSPKNQSTKTNLSEGFGNYNKKNPYVFNKISFYDYIKQSLSTLFSKNNASENSKNLSILA